VNSVGIIPARIASTRLPSKPLIEIAGRPLLEWVILAVRARTNLNHLIVATDNERIVALAKKNDVEAIMTDPHLPSGTDRVFAAVKDRDVDVVLNIQGDEPLVRPVWINALLAEFEREPSLNMATVATKLPDAELNQPSVVKVILDHQRNGIYFSRHGIPYSRQTPIDSPDLALKHIGLYGFRKNFLQQFCQRGATPLERAESLEQLRALYMGERIRVLPIEGPSIGIDTPEDVEALERILATQTAPSSVTKA
jgi:3-deoxy-manno-octulosonate cytidylyltransferase (CMP-KDO synthetase)